jgi:hypothetical protein
MMKKEAVRLIEILLFDSYETVNRVIPFHVDKFTDEHSVWGTESSDRFPFCKPT